jgi:Kinesin motor domain
VDVACVIHRESKLSLIDLAGSERASATNNTGALLRQGASINKSLLSLANCINALASNARNAASSGGGSAASTAAAGSASGAGRAPTNVKYRDSKLTHLLKTSLEGQCRLIMIANVNPSHTMYDDSHNTLKYANRAKDIKVAPRAAAGEKESAAWPAREARLQREVQALREANAELRAQLEHTKTLQLEQGHNSSSSSSSNNAALALLTATQHATEEVEDEYERSLAGHAWEADSLREADERTEDYQSPTKKRRVAAAAAAAAPAAPTSAEDTDGEHSSSSRQRRVSGSGAAARIAQLERTLREVTEAGGSSGSSRSSASAAVAQLQRERSEARARAADLEARVDELTHTREVMSQLNEEWRGRKDEAEAAAVAERAAADACLRQLRAREKDNAALRSDLELLRRQLAGSTASGGSGSSSSAAAASPALQQQRPATTLGIALTRGRRSMTPQQQHRVASVSEEGLPPASAAASSSSAAVAVDDNFGGLHLSMPGDENDAAQLGAAMKRTRSRRSSMIPRCVLHAQTTTAIVD